MRLLALGQGTRTRRRALLCRSERLVPPRFCDPAAVPAVHEGRPAAVALDTPAYLVLGTFRAGEHDPEGVTERRWLTPAALKEQGVEASALRRKLEEYEAAVAAAREAALGAGRTVT